MLKREPDFNFPMPNIHLAVVTVPLNYFEIPMSVIKYHNNSDGI